MRRAPPRRGFCDFSRPLFIYIFHRLFSSNILISFSIFYSVKRGAAARAAAQRKGICMNEKTPETDLRMRSHCVHLDGRELLSVTGVTDVTSFNDTEILLSTEAGGMCVSGVDLHIRRLDLEGGCISVEGTVDAIEYDEPAPEKRGSLLSRIFR